jgi:hypothetical protein
VHGLAQVVTEDRVRRGDPGQRPADGLAHGHTGTLTLVGEGPDAPAEPRRARQLADQPVPLGTRFRVPACLLVNLGVQAPEAVPVLGEAG